MPFLPDTRYPRDRRVEFGKADEAREKKRAEDSAAIDPAAVKWRYRPVPCVVKAQK
jgi:hypothetical protein